MRTSSSCSIAVVVLSSLLLHAIIHLTCNQLTSTLRSTRVRVADYKYVHNVNTLPKPTTTPTDDSDWLTTLSKNPSFPFLSSSTSHIQDLNVLYLCTSKYYWSRMDRFFIHQFEGTQQHSQVNHAQLWVVDAALNGYDTSKSLIGNIKHVYRSVDYFHIVALIHEMQLLPAKDLCELHKAAKGKTIIVWHRHESRNAIYAKDLLERYCLDVVAFPYPNEMSVLRSLAKDKVFIQIPFGSHPPLFLGEVDSTTKSIDVLLAGNRNRFYPLREAFEAVMPELVKKLDMKHYLKTSKEVSPWLFKDTESDEERLELLNEQMDKWADTLKSAKICLIGPSMYGYTVMKYTEMTLAGCFLIGSVPHSLPHIWSNFVVNVAPDTFHLTDIGLLEREIKYWLSHEKEREERVRIAQQFVLKYFTWERTFDYVIHAYELALKKQYGLHYTFGYQDKCRVIHDIHSEQEDHTDNLFCSKEDNMEFSGRVKGKFHDPRHLRLNFTF